MVTMSSTFVLAHAILLFLSKRDVLSFHVRFRVGSVLNINVTAFKFEKSPIFNASRFFRKTVVFAIERKENKLISFNRYSMG